MSWTTGYATVLRVLIGPTRSQTLAAEIAAATEARKPKQRPYIGPRVSCYERPNEAIRGEVLRNQIRSLQATDPRNRHERRKKAAILQGLRKELNG